MNLKGRTTAHHESTRNKAADLFRVSSFHLPMPARKKFNVYAIIDGRDILPEALLPFTDHFNLLQHRILTRRWQWQTDEKTGTFTTLKREYIEKELTSQVAGKLLKWALGPEGVLVTDGHYVEGQKSYGYKFRPALNDLKAKRLPLTDEGLMERISTLERRDYKKYTKAHRHLKGWLDAVTIGCDALHVACGDHLNEKQREANAGAVTMLLNHDLTFTVCDYGRVHTNLTRLYKPLRKYLRITSTSKAPDSRITSSFLTSLDIANSQPLFLGIAYLNTQTRGTCKTLLSETSAVSYAPIRSQNGPFQDRNCQTEPEVKCSFYLSETGLESGRDLTLKEDVKSYLQTCCEGVLYQRLMEAMNWTGTKEEFKAGCWFQFLYGSNKVERLLEGKDDLRRLNVAFRELFPTIYDFIWDKKKTNYRQLARDMQRAESKLMIDDVAGRLRDKYPDIPVLTIHDSYMTTAEHVKTVAGIIMDEFRKIGVTPTLTIEAPEDQGHHDEDHHEDATDER